jgi:hypothetical protein
LLIGRESKDQKELGGLGILDLSKFNRAFRLRWQWYKWKDHNKPWASMTVRQSEKEEKLFCACTTITWAIVRASNFGTTDGCTVSIQRK